MSTLAPAGLDATLVLVRHGESTWIPRRRFQGQRNPWLTAHGRAQAAAAARRVAEPLAPPPLPIPPGPPVAIWYSPLRRARDTARTIADLVPVELIGDPRLSEIGQGDWETRSHHWVASTDSPALAAWRRDPVRHVPPGGETLQAVRGRVRASLRDILAALSGRSGRGVSRSWGLVVSHEGTLRVAVLVLLGLPLSQFWEYPFDLCSVSVVEFGGGRAALTVHNLTDHLAGLEAPGL